MTACWVKGRTKRYAYYSCRNSCEGSTPKDVLERSFVEMLETLRPDPDMLKLVEAEIRRQWDEEEIGAETQRQAAKGRVRTLKARKRRLEEAYIYEGAIDKQAYEEHATRISADLMVAERELYSLRLNRLEFEDALEMAKAISLDAVRFWEATPTALVDTFLSTLFPHGLVASGGRISNPVSTRFFLGLQAETRDLKDLVARTGFEPVLPA